MKYLKLFENFDPENILDAKFDDLVTTESLNYLYACLDHVARSCAKESKHLPSRQPIDEMLRAVKEYGSFYSINVTGRHLPKAGYMNFQTSLRDSYSYLQTLDKYLNFTSDNDNTPSNIIRPTGALKNIFENGLQLIKNILEEFNVYWHGKIGPAPEVGSSGKQSIGNVPHWK